MASLAILGGIGAGVGTSAAGIGTLGAIGTGLATTGILGSGISSYQQGQYNAQLAEQKAKATQRSLAFNQQIEQRKFDRLLGQNRLRTAASGLEFSGSPLDVEISNRYEFEMEQLAQRYNANVQTSQMLSQAEQSRRAGSVGLFNSLLSAAGLGFSQSTLLGEESRNSGFTLASKG